MARHVYPIDEVCHLWAHGIDRDIRSNNGNVFTAGDTIYSYGMHFPMAKRIVLKDKRVVFLFNPDRYSKTTGQHQSRTQRAAGGNGQEFSIPVSLWRYVKRGDGGTQLRDYYDREILLAMSDANNTRCGYWRRQGGVDRAIALHLKHATLRSLFKLRTRKDIMLPTMPDLEESRAKYDAREKKKQEEWRDRNAEWQRQEDELKASVPERIIQWRDGERVSTRFFPSHPLVRIKNRVVETTMGARVTVDEALKFIEEDLPRVIEQGHDVDVKIGYYVGAHADKECLRIGCHRFLWSEVELLTGKLKECGYAETQEENQGEQRV